MQPANRKSRKNSKSNRDFIQENIDHLEQQKKKGRKRNREL